MRRWIPRICSVVQPWNLVQIWVWTISALRPNIAVIGVNSTIGTEPV